jgi:hypothetical protein
MCPHLTLPNRESTSITTAKKLQPSFQPFLVFRENGLRLAESKFQKRIKEEKLG